ncbi:MAG: hypothetical protein R3F33_03405 [Planctomycetota bacterium]
MNPNDVVLRQGSFGALRSMQKLLSREGIDTQVICPPGVNAGA